MRQRSVTTCSSSASVPKERLASGSSRTGQRGPAGWGLGRARGGGGSQNRPEGLSRLEFGRVPGQGDEPDPIRHNQVRRGVPAGLVEPKHDDALRFRPGLAANSASNAAKNGLVMPFNTDQK